MVAACKQSGCEVGMISEEKLGRLAHAAIDRSIRKPSGSSVPQLTTKDAESHFKTLSGNDPGKILARLMRSLRDERRRGLAGHWSYDLNRHIALAQAYAAELQNRRLNAVDPRPVQSNAGGTGAEEAGVEESGTVKSGTGKSTI
jgi:hypothetical protein